MWSPTHVQVLVKKAKGLNVKGKNGTNDALVTIALGKEKYQTSVKEKAVNPVEWCEQCELAIPEQGNRAEVVLVVLHRWPLETFCMMYNVHCTYSGGLFIAFCM